MIYIENDSLDPFYNHALEEYFLTESDLEFCLLWRNRPAVLIGRNQNALNECRLDYIHKHKIAIVRRLSGGGTVYTDPDNVNFTVITSAKAHSKDQPGQFQRFADPVIRALHELGVQAEFSGRNDIIVNGQKISGNAQYVNKDRLLHHGTLLFSGDLQVLASVLTPATEKLKEKYIESVRSRVTTIKEHQRDKTMSVVDFIAHIKKSLVREYNINKCHIPDHTERQKIEKIMKERFLTDHWNFGKVPERGIKKRHKYPAGLVEVYLTVKSGKITEIRFFGDFFGFGAVSDLEALLIGTDYNQQEIFKVLKRAGSDFYISGILPEELSCLFFKTEC